MTLLPESTPQIANPFKAPEFVGDSGTITVPHGARVARAVAYGAICTVLQVPLATLAIVNENSSLLGVQFPLVHLSSTVLLTLACQTWLLARCGLLTALLAGQIVNVLQWLIFCGTAGVMNSMALTSMRLSPSDLKIFAVIVFSVAMLQAAMTGIARALKKRVPAD